MQTSTKPPSPPHEHARFVDKEALSIADKQHASSLSAFARWIMGTHACMPLGQCGQLMTRVGCLQKVWLANSYHCSRIITCDLAVHYLVSSTEMSCLMTPWQALGVVNPVDQPGTCGNGKAGHRV